MSFSTASLRKTPRAPLPEISESTILVLLGITAVASLGLMGVGLSALL